MIDHLHLVVRDLEKSKKFYEAVLGVLGLRIGAEGPGFFYADELFVSSLGEGMRISCVHFAFQAHDRATVDRFYEVALKAGGRDNGAPGERPHYHPGYYGAFVLDPDGNNIEATYHGPHERSAGSVVISYS